MHRTSGLISKFATLTSSTCFRVRNCVPLRIPIRSSALGSRTAFRDLHHVNAARSVWSRSANFRFGAPRRRFFGTEDDHQPRLESDEGVITSKFGKLIPTPNIPGLIVYEDFLTPQEHDSLIRAIKKSKLPSVPIDDERVGKFIRYLEPCEEAWNIMEKIGDSGLLGDETELLPEGIEDTNSNDEREALRQVASEAGLSSLALEKDLANPSKVFKKKPISPDEGEDDPIYLNFLNDEKGKPMVPDMQEDEMPAGMMGNSFFIQEYPPDGYLAPTMFIPGTGDTEVLVSFYSPVVMNFRSLETGETQQVLIKPRSVYVVKDEALQKWTRSFPADQIQTYKGKPVAKGTRYVLKFCLGVDPNVFKQGEEEEEEEEEAVHQQKLSTPLAPKKKNLK